MERRKVKKSEREMVYAKCNGHCAYCGCSINYKEMQVDHIHPLRRGGADELQNMLPACRSCNHYKHTLTVDEFRKYLECIPERLTRDSVAFNMGIRFGIVASIQKPVIFYFEKHNKEN